MQNWHNDSKRKKEAERFFLNNARATWLARLLFWNKAIMTACRFFAVHVNSFVLRFLSHELWWNILCCSAKCRKHRRGHFAKIADGKNTACACIKRIICIRKCYGPLAVLPDFKTPVQISRIFLLWQIQCRGYVQFRSIPRFTFWKSLTYTREATRIFRTFFFFRNLISLTSSGDF